MFARKTCRKHHFSLIVLRIPAGAALSGQGSERNPARHLIRTGTIIRLYVRAGVRNRYTGVPAAVIDLAICQKCDGVAFSLQSEGHVYLADVCNVIRSQRDQRAALKGVQIRRIVLNLCLWIAFRAKADRPFPICRIKRNRSQFSCWSFGMNWRHQPRHQAKQCDARYRSSK